MYAYQVSSLTYLPSLGHIGLKIHIPLAYHLLCIRNSHQYFHISKGIQETKFAHLIMA